MEIQDKVTHVKVQVHQRLILDPTLHRVVVAAPRVLGAPVENGAVRHVGLLQVGVLVLHGEDFRQRVLALPDRVYPQEVLLGRLRLCLRWNNTGTVQELVGLSTKPWRVRVTFATTLYVTESARRRRVWLRDEEVLTSHDSPRLFLVWTSVTSSEIVSVRDDELGDTWMAWIGPLSWKRRGFSAWNRGHVHLKCK